MIKGSIASIESMGLLDGPGIRVVVFLQGCPLRCKYCHNPEMWETNKKTTLMTPQELLDKVERFRPYFKDDGGITFSGGEPLLQKDFLLAALKECKKRDIHTCLDTSGSVLNCEEVLDYVDLVIFDIKAVDEGEYKELTGRDISTSLKFLKACQKKGKKMWLRQVIVPGINDDEKHILALKEFISPLKNIERVELLPYHSMAEGKYRELGIKYVLEGLQDMDKERCKSLEMLLKV